MDFLYTFISLFKLWPINLHINANITAAITTPNITISNVMFPLKIIHAKKNSTYICNSPNTTLSFKGHNIPIIFHCSTSCFICLRRNINFIQLFISIKGPFALDYLSIFLLLYNAIHGIDNPMFSIPHSTLKHIPYAYISAVFL